MRRKSQQTWALYCRSYLVTIGLLMLAGSAFTLYLAYNGSIFLQWWALAIIGTLVCGGAALIGIGLLGSHSLVDKWADAASSHEASVVLMVISFPVYCVLKPFYQTR
ncbi:hypothetical protein [Agrobacterium bohemicum]|uniref:hypothetical protein n=1 Tax=Agrobacterium bohemicum TaxID=2052828 RepID=UPI000AAB4799|nr:hypothetical protein [Agrobacterium bohemicum]